MSKIMKLEIYYNDTKCRWEIPIPFQDRRDFRVFNDSVRVAIAGAIRAGIAIASGKEVPYFSSDSSIEDHLDEDLRQWLTSSSKA
ncbi:hypothetical protein LCGC14_2539330 [marine sediment metagenome]|uniref:Uncharacterized protein n=1 Tax=marine sediment metagenome TaxID=412755 RepID=A0A0F9D2P4_9ZZZZ